LPSLVIGDHWPDKISEPLHVARFGPEFRAEGVLAGSKDAARCIRYLTKYLTKQVADCHQADTAAQRAHMDRLAEALRYEPCSPTCANWLRYGIQPKNARPGLRPGLCKGKAHRPEHVGYAGRRVLTSRKWSGKTLADHRGDHKAWLVETLGLEVPDPSRYTWHVVTPGDPDCLPPDKRLLRVVAERSRWKAAVAEAKRRAREGLAELSAIPNTAVDDGLIRRNPCRVKGAGQEESPERPIITSLQIWQIADVIDPRYRALVLLAGFGRLRWGELAALRRCDIDLEAGAVRITWQLNEVSGRLAFGPPKSAAGRRVVHFPAVIAPELRWHLGRFAQAGDNGLVFNLRVASVSITMTISQPSPAGSASSPFAIPRSRVGARPGEAGTDQPAFP
jgi:hypothetical protein